MNDRQIELYQRKIDAIKLKLELGTGDTEQLKEDLTEICDIILDYYNELFEDTYFQWEDALENQDTDAVLKLDDDMKQINTMIETYLTMIEDIDKSTSLEPEPDNDNQDIPINTDNLNEEDKQFLDELENL